MSEATHNATPMTRKPCGFIGPQLLGKIAESNRISDQARKCASYSVSHCSAYHSKRTTISQQQHAHHHPSGGFVSPDTLHAVSESTEVSDGAHAAAQKTLLHQQAISDSRQQHQERLAAQKSPTTLSRKIYDAQGGPAPVKLVRSEGQPRALIRSVNNAYDGLGIVHDFYRTVFKRNSIDNKGMELVAIVNLNPDPVESPLGYLNAYWDGEQMVFGAGDGEVFDDFTDGLDIIAHELTHGVTQFTANLEYKGQAGALNESWSDIASCLVEQWWFNQSSSEGDWLLGQGLLSMLRRGPSLRSLKAPGTAYKNDPVLGTDGQPSTMAGYLETEEDEGGVHTNSGIPNHAFYLAATALGGRSWDKPGHIWYATITDPSIKPTCNFEEFAALTVKHATALYGPGDGTTVRNAWIAVGISV